MSARRWTHGVALVASTVAVACSSSTAGDSGPPPCPADAGACEVGRDPAPCELVMPLSGALVGTARAKVGACGQVAYAPFVIADMAVISFHLNEVVCPGATGTLSMHSISIIVGDPKVPQIWTTPEGACVITVDSNVCQSDALGKRAVLTGHGSCRQPARPESGSDAPVYISDFTFTFGQR